MNNPTLLTKKRARWAKNRKSVVFKGTPLRNNVAVENRYVTDLERITNQMIDAVSREVMRLYRSPAAKQYFAMDSSIGSQARITMNRLENQFDEIFSQYAKPYAERMVNRVGKQSATALHSSLKQLSGGLSIKTDIVNGELREITKATIAENVDLIKTIPEKFFTDVRGAVMRSIAQPNQGGMAELIENIDSMLDQRSRQIRNKAKNLALDQTRKLYNNTNMARMQAVGINRFEWIHGGGGQKPRPLHKFKLNGKTYSFDDLPVIDERSGERGIPGQAPNCGCTMRPVL